MERGAQLLRLGEPGQRWSKGEVATRPLLGRLRPREKEGELQYYLDLKFCKDLRLARVGGGGWLQHNQLVVSTGLIALEPTHIFFNFFCHFWFQNSHPTS